MRITFEHLKVVFLILCTFPVSCETSQIVDEAENGGSSDGKDKTILLRVNVPRRGISSYASENASEDENHIDTLFVMLYQNNEPVPRETFKYCGSDLTVEDDSIINIKIETEKLSGGGPVRAEVFANRTDAPPITGEIPLPDKADPLKWFMMSGSETLVYSGISYGGTVHIVRNVAKLRVRISEHPAKLPYNMIIHYDKTKIEVVSTPDRTQPLPPPPISSPSGLAYTVYSPRAGVDLRPESLFGTFAGGQIDSLYLNENYLEETDYADDGKRTQIKISITTEVPGYPEKTSDYTYPLFTESSYRVKRNYIYTLDIKVAGQSLDPFVTLDIQPWDDVAVNGDINGVYLSLEQSELELLPVHTENSPVRVGYHTDNTSVSLDWSRVDPAHNIDPSVTEIQGMNGEIKIYWRAGGAPLQAFRDTVYVVSRNIRKALILKYGLPGTAGNWVGAFYRWNQTGERIIKMPGEGDWTATVTQGGDFIVLDGTPSTDPALNTDLATRGNDPGFDAGHPVNSTATTLTGKGLVFFRIGLKSQLAYLGAAPRYGVVEVTGDGMGTRKIYVRQGEEADYIMSPGDANPSDANNPREYAVRFSPYNLSDPGRGAGGGNIDAHSIMPFGETVFSSSKFTDYPSQGGYLFQWNLGAGSSHRAYHPVNPVAGPISSWETAVKNAWERTFEPCPTGYRHPGDSLQSATLSEVRQSLYLTPGSGDGALNSVTGYYADGFFDRLPINQSPNGADSTTVSFSLTNLADAVNTRVAYSGRLIYNPTTNASIFLPAAGFRDGSGMLTGTGEDGAYWTRTKNSDGFGWTFSFTPSSFSGIGTTAYQYSGLSIRCVKDDFGLPGSH